MTLFSYLGGHGLTVCLCIVCEGIIFALLLQKISALYACKISWCPTILCALAMSVLQELPIFACDLWIGPRPMSMGMYALLLFVNPLLVPVAYASLRYAMRIPVNRCAAIAQRTICYANLSKILFIVSQRSMVAMHADGDTTYRALLIAASVTVLVIVALGRVIEWRNVRIPITSGMGRRRFALGRAMIESAMVFGFLVLYRIVSADTPYILPGTVVADRDHYIVFAFPIIASITYVVLDLYREILEVKRYELDNLKTHITALGDAYEQLRGIKHDINNILQIYDGYIAMNNLDKLKDYHTSVLHMTRSAATRMELCQTLEAYPPVMSLIAAAEERAEAMGVDLTVSCSKLQAGLPLSDVELCRVLGILLDNALEASGASARRRMTVSIESRPEGALFIIANSSDVAFNIGQIFNKGYSTKGTERGFGLYEVNKIVKKNSSCSLHVNQYEDTVTFCLSMDYAQGLVAG